MTETAQGPHAFIAATLPRPKTGPPVLRAARADESLSPSDISPEKAKLHYQSYHDYYYSITPRDPRLEAPLKPIWPDPAEGCPALLSPVTPTAARQESEVAELTSYGPSRLNHTPPPQPAADEVKDKPAVESAIPAQPRIAAAPRASPAERPLSRQGNTHQHQPYATTPMTPDFLPTGLLDRSPAISTLTLPGGGADYDAYHDRHAAAQHTSIYASPVYYPQVTAQAAPMMVVPPESSFQRQLQPQPIASLPAGQPPAGGFNMYRGRGTARGRGGAQVTPPQTATTLKSALLQQFHDTARTNLTLPELAGHIVEFSVDQDGSRLVQRLMVDEASADVVFREVMGSLLNLIVDVFGNYVIQRLFECGGEKHHNSLIQAMRGNILGLAVQTYGCRVIQKALQYAKHEDQRAIAKELQGHVAECVRDQNGNHVIQKCIEMMPNEAQFIADAFRGQLPGLASHAYGCRVMQRLFERCPNTDPALEAMVNETLGYTSVLVNDQYGNYVIQHIIINGTHQWRQGVLNLLLNSFSKLSCSKFSSNVTEKLFLHSDEGQRRMIIEAILNERDQQGRCSLVVMMQDQYANYVVQRLLDLSPQPLREKMVEAVTPFLGEIKRFTYGKHIAARLEKMGLLPRSAPQGGGGFHYQAGGQHAAAATYSPPTAPAQPQHMPSALQFPPNSFPQAASVFSQQQFSQQAVFSQPAATYQLVSVQSASPPFSIPSGAISVNFGAPQTQSQPRIVQPVAPIAEPYSHPAAPFPADRPAPIDSPSDGAHRRAAGNQRFTQSSTAFHSKMLSPSSLPQIDPAVASAFPAHNERGKMWPG